jgi:IS30 family transposase
LAVEFGCSSRTVQRIAVEASLVRPRAVSGRRLSFAERERISRGIAAGESDSEIARALGRHRATIGREIRACGGGRRQRYRALAGERAARARARRPKLDKLSSFPRLLAAVEAGLQARWSPQQIAARLQLEYPDDAEMRISHETIYRSLYVQSRGELRRQLSAQLRTGRSRRRPQGRVAQRARIPDMVSISERPPEVEDRAVPGHWEGDLLVGGAQQSFVATLVERQTRYVLLARLGSRRSSEHVVDALKARIVGLPEQLLRSLTWDQGTELSAHARFKQDTGIDIYFCDPRSPWQRGSNENTNGLLRQYLPKGSDLAV